MNNERTGGEVNGVSESGRRLFIAVDTGLSEREGRVDDAIPQWNLAITRWPSLTLIISGC